MNVPESYSRALEQETLLFNDQFRSGGSHLVIPPLDPRFGSCGHSHIFLISSPKGWDVLAARRDIDG